MSTIKLKKLLTPEKIDQIIAKEERNIFGFFIKHFRFTYLILIGIITLGLFAMLTLPKEAEPEIQIPYAFVSAVYPGANPSDTEELITNKIEEKIKNIEDLKRYTSSSGVGISSVFVEFEAEADMIDSMNKLKDAVDLAKPSLPKDANDPIVTQLNFNDQSLITYSLVGEGYSEAELKYYADILQKKIEGVKDVSRAPIIGGLEREFQVIVDQSRLANHNLSLGQVVSAISRTNFNMPAGDIDIDGFTYNVRVKGKFTDANGLRDVVVTSVNNTPIYLRDIAQIKDTYKEKKSESRVGVGRNTPSKTVSLQVYKKTGGNILKMVDEANEIVTETKQSEVWPSTLDILKTNDLAVFVRDDFNTLGRSGLQTMILIVLILSLALGVRAAVISSFSVPIAFLMAFIVLMSQDMTLNSMVLFALVLSLGLMVDNSIIIIEGISEYMGKYHISAYQAGILSVWNYRWPIIAGTLTTVCAFAPMLLVSGIMGEYMGIMPKTIMATLLSSLFVALIVIPVLASKFISHTRSQEEYQDNNEDNSAVIQDHFQGRKFRPVKKLKEIYGDFMAGMIRDKKKRRWMLTVAWIAFILSAIMPVVGLMKVEMFPKMDIDFIVVNIELPVGSVLASTEQIATEVEKIVIDNLPEIDNYVTNIGQSVNINMGFGTGSGSHLASIMINLDEDRQQKSYQISENLRPLVKKVQDAKVSVLELSAGPPTGAPIEVRIYGEDLKTISLATKDVKNILDNLKGVINVDDNLADTTGEFTFSIDRQKTNYYGLDVATVASTLRNAIYGTTASEVLLDGEDVEIVVKYDKDKFSSVGDLENLLIFTAKGPTPLKNIASVKLEPSLLSINHRDGKNTISISADIKEGVNLKKVLKEFDQQKKELDLPASINIEMGGEVEDITQSFRELFMSMIVSVLLIAFILVLQFNSFKQPLIIIFALPLAIPGVMIGLFVTGLAFGFPAFIGIVALSGIVVNDSIVLIDKINKNIRGGIEFYEAIIEAGIARLQPILLTTLTTIAGILPLYFANELWRGLSVTIAFGLAFSTLLTLIMVPIMYVWLCKKDYDKSHNA